MIVVPFLFSETYTVRMTTMVKLLRKLAPATVTPDLLKRLDGADAPKEVHLYDVYGTASKFKEGKTNYGEYLGFRGSFEAIRGDTGEIIASNMCFVPQPFQDLLYSKMLDTQKDDPKAQLEFAIRISIVPPKPGKPSSTGYEYLVMPIIEDRSTSPLSNLREKVQQFKLSPPKPADAANTEQKNDAASEPKTETDTIGRDDISSATRRPVGARR